MSMRNTLAMMSAVLAATILSGSGAVAQPKAAMPPQEKISYYLGEVTIKSGEGNSLGSQLSLVKRTETATEGKIIEQIIAIKADDTTREYIANYKVTGAQFTFTDPEGTYTGEGEMTGKPDDWTSWKYTVTMKGGVGTIVGMDMKTDDGIVSQKTFLSADGKVGARFSTKLKTISPSEYLILRKKLLGT